MGSELDLGALLDETGALLSGHFRLSSGLHSPNYVQCALLLEHPENARKVASALARRIDTLRPSMIVAPALGGVVIGYAVAERLGIPMVFTERKDGEMQLRRGFGVSDRGPAVIVEDVVTTGKSTRETAEVVQDHGGDLAGFASILNRSGTENPFDGPYEYLMALNFETWPESECPLCAEKRPLDSPGSRHPNR